MANETIFWRPDWRFRPSPTWTDVRFKPLFTEAVIYRDETFINSTAQITKETITSTATISVNDSSTILSSAIIRVTDLTSILSDAIISNIYPESATITSTAVIFSTVVSRPPRVIRINPWMVVNRIDAADAGSKIEVF